MKTTHFQVGKKVLFPEFYENQVYGCHVTLAGIFSVNQEVIKVYDDKNIMFFCYNFIKIALKAGRCVEKIEKHDLVLEMVVPRLKGCFPLVIFPNSHFIICVCQV